MVEEKKIMAEHHHAHQASPEVKPAEAKMNVNYWMISTLVMVLLLLLSVFTDGFGFGGLSKDKAGDKALSFINTNLLQGQAVAEIKSITEEGGLYNMKLDVNGQEIDSYVSKDGNLFFPQAINMVETEQLLDSKTASTPQELPKTAKPIVELFVMSHCPYGTQAEKGIIPAIEKLGNKVDFKVRFVHYAMHGEKEVKEQMNQACIQNEQTAKYLLYLKCFLKAGQGEECLAEAKVDTAKLSTCVKALDTKYKIMSQFNDKSTWSGGQFPPFDVDKTSATKYGVQGSPTLVINGEQASSDRSSGAYLKTICGAFTTEPAECGAQLSTTAASPGFGYGTAAASASAASCVT